MWIPEETLFPLAWKGLVVLLVAFVAARAAARRSAATRHLVWCSAMAALAVLPLASALLPSWHTPVALQNLVAFRSPAVEPADPAANDIAARVADEGEALPGNVSESLPAHDLSVPSSEETASHATGESETAGSVRPERSVPLSPGVLFLWVWGVGVVFFLLDIVAGHVLAWRATVKAEVADDPRLLAAMAESRRKLGLATPIDLRLSSNLTVPCTWGVVRPTILLPADSPTWESDRLQMVLTHELGHVKRFDWITQLVAHVACAVHWFNPLAWVARANTIREQEVATDDLVLRVGNVPYAYATSLLDFARVTVRGRRTFAATIAISRRSTLEGRLLAILDPARRRAAVRGWRVLATGLLVTTFLIPLAAMQPAPGNASEAAGIEAAATPTAASFPIVMPPAISSTAASSTVTSDEPVDEPTGDRADVDFGRESAGLDMSNEVPADADADADTTRIRVLLEALGAETDPEVRIFLIQILGNMESRLATPGLSRVLLEDPNEDARRAAAWALYEIEDPASVAALAQSLEREQSVDVRSSVIQALGEIGSRESVPAIERALTSDASPEIREAAAWALGEMEVPSSVEALERALDDESAEVRLKAAWALGEIASDRSAGLLERLLSDESAEVRRYAAHALAEISSLSSVAALKRAVQDSDRSVREAAVYALGEIGSDEAVDALMSALSDESADIRARAAWSLAEIGSASAEEALIGALRDDDAEVRAHVARALGEIRADAAADALLELLRNDPSPEVRKMAAHALSELDF